MAESPPVTVPQLRQAAVSLQVGRTATHSSSSIALQAGPSTTVSLPLQSPQGSQQRFSAALAVQPSHLPAAPAPLAAQLISSVPNSHSSEPDNSSPHKGGSLVGGMHSVPSGEECSEAQLFAKEAAQLQKFAQNLKVSMSCRICAPSSNIQVYAEVQQPVCWLQHLEEHACVILPFQPDVWQLSAFA